MKIGINGSALLGQGTLEAFEAHARTAAEDGFTSYWIAQAGSIDALTLITSLAQSIPNLSFGTAVIPTYPRHPSMLASQAMTTQMISGGRLTLGIGLSHKPVIEGSFGMSFDKPVRHMREYLSILVPLIEEGKVIFEGETLTARGDISLPDTTPCPVLVAALGPQMLRLAGKRAAGTILWMVGERTIGEHIKPVISESAAKAGRPDPQIIAGLPVCVTDQPAEVRKKAARAFAIYGQLPSYRAMLDREGAADPSDVCVIGGEQEVNDRLSAIAESGATEFAAVEFAGSEEEESRTRQLLANWKD
jgi:5,10-methylenetetrahydromethanopterin reductase